MCFHSYNSDHEDNKFSHCFELTKYVVENIDIRLISLFLFDKTKSKNFHFLFLFQVNSAYQSGNIFSIIDSQMGAYPSECVGKFVSLALKCCQDETDMRPSMSEVVRELEVIWRMTPESDVMSTDSVVTESLDTNTTPSSSSVTGNPFSTLNFSGNSFSNLYPR